MRGGSFGGQGKCCALRLVLASLIGLIWSSCADTFTQNAKAAESVVEEQCDREQPNEKSILVSSGKSRGEGLPTTVGSDGEQDDALEPIANVSEREPDLADPTAIAGVPDLADPRGSDSQDSSAKVAANQSESLPVCEALSFHGIVPGISHRREVFRKWGDPRNEETTAETLLYRFEKLHSVRAKFEGDIVDTIAVELNEPSSTEDLAQKLQLDTVLPATLRDEDGIPLALAYPERGVVLRYAGEDQIGEVVIQPIKAASFLLRAENNPSTNLTKRMEDLHQALKLDSDSAHARWLLSDTYLTLGQAASAERYAAEAVELEPLDHRYRLQHAKCLRLLARYEEALEQTREVMDSPESDSLVRARALYETGLLASLSSKKVAQRTVPLLTKAIEIADQLAIEHDAKVTEEAKELLVEAHLAVAVEIAKGKWAQKDKTVPQWIERASAISEEMISTDKSNLRLRLQVAVSALAAAASFEEPIDPALWVEEAEETVYLLHASTEDAQTRDVYDWHLGLAYFHAAQIQHRRSDSEGAEDMGELAIARLGGLAGSREEVADTAYLMGRLYFQIGAVHAVHHENHEIACQWYDKAVEYLSNSVPVSVMAAPQQHGDALVSMGVSYWHTKQHAQAIEVTEVGAHLIEQAVQRGILQSETLTVPYNNLANMYESMGESEPASKYSAMAKKITRSKVSSKPTPQKRS